MQIAVKQAGWQDAEVWNLSGQFLTDLLDLLGRFREYPLQVIGNDDDLVVDQLWRNVAR